MDHGSPRNPTAAESADGPVEANAASVARFAVSTGVDALAREAALYALASGQRDGLVWRDAALGEVVVVGLREVAAGTTAKVVVTGAAAPPADPPPLFWGGRAFDAQAAPSALWRGWPERARWVAAQTWWTRPDGTQWTVRRLQMSCDRGRVRAPGGAEASSPALTPRRWAKLVQDALTAIEHGALAKVVAARRTEQRTDPPQVGRWLRATPGAGETVFALRPPGAGAALLVGVTPESLALVRDGTVATMALAGTRPADAADRLLASDKDRREHAAVVEHIEARLRPLTTEWRPAGQPRLRRAGHLVHLETPLQGRLAPGVGLSRVVDALHPTPAVAGAPVSAALTWLRTHEALDRGWYGGTVWHEDAHGGGHAVVVLRCALVGDQTVSRFAGAGLVAGSVAGAEWDETAAKLQRIDALGAAPGGRDG